MNNVALKDFADRLPRLSVLAGWLALLVVFFWSYADVFSGLVGFWQGPDYQHGFFVAPFCLILLLVRGRMICGRVEDDDWWLNRLWSGKDWVGTLGRSKTAWVGAIGGAALAAPLYIILFPQATEYGVEGVTLAAVYGGALGVLVMLVAELFRRSGSPGRPTFVWSWWAAAFFAVWALMRLFSAFLVVERTDEWSILPLAAGVTLFVGGWAALRWAWPSIVFLYFMTPLPGAVQDQLGSFLQRVGTVASVYVIQTLGIPAVQQANGSNVIELPEATLGVAEACSGIRMLMLFFAVCVGAAFVLRCPLWKKAVIVVSAVPIAVFSNVIRITVTAILFEMSRKWPEYISEKAAYWMFHSGAGLLMMPLAMVLLLVLWYLLDKLVVDEAPSGPLALGSSMSLARAKERPRPTTKP